MRQFRRRVALRLQGLPLPSGLGCGSAGPARPVPECIRRATSSSWLAFDTGSSNTVTHGLNGDGTLLRSCAGPDHREGMFAQRGRRRPCWTSWIRSGAPGVGFANGGIGVREKGTPRARPAAAVDAARDETLRAGLTRQLVTWPVDPVAAMSASLDVDLKQSAQILASRDTRVAPRPVRPNCAVAPQIGATLPTPGGPVPDDKVFICNNPADSGPDSGINNNCRWEISAPSWTRTKPTSRRAVRGRRRVRHPDAQAPHRLLLAHGWRRRTGRRPGLPDAARTSGRTPIRNGGRRVRRSSSSSTVSSTAVRGRTRSPSGATLRPRGSGWSTSAAPRSPAWRTRTPHGRASTRTGGSSPRWSSRSTSRPRRRRCGRPRSWWAAVTQSRRSPWSSTSWTAPNWSTRELGACPAEYYADPAAFDPEAEGYGYPYACLVSAERGSGKLNKYATYTAYVFGDAGMRR